MLKSTLKKKTITKATQEVLEQVSQISIYNKGTLNFDVMGETVEPNGNPFHAPYGGCYYTFDLDEINFSGANVTENRANIIYQKVILPKETQPTNCPG